MSCIIFGYRRFYAIICKITHFFFFFQKRPTPTQPIDDRRTIYAVLSDRRIIYD